MSDEGAAGAGVQRGATAASSRRLRPPGSVGAAAWLPWQCLRVRIRASLPYIRVANPRLRHPYLKEDDDYPPRIARLATPMRRRGGARRPGGGGRPRSRSRQRRRPSPGFRRAKPAWTVQKSWHDLGAVRVAASSAPSQRRTAPRDGERAVFGRQHARCGGAVSSPPRSTEAFMLRDPVADWRELSCVVRAGGGPGHARAQAWLERTEDGRST